MKIDFNSKCNLWSHFTNSNRRYMAYIRPIRRKTPNNFSMHSLYLYPTLSYLYTVPLIQIAISITAFITLRAKQVNFWLVYLSLYAILVTVTKNLCWYGWFWIYLWKFCFPTGRRVKLFPWLLIYWLIGN